MCFCTPNIRTPVCKHCPYDIQVKWGLKKGKSMTDNVNHPQHYTSSNAQCPACQRNIECIDVTRHMGFNAGNAIKYIWRYQYKNGLEDLKKARWYLDDMIKQLESEQIK